MKTTLTSRSFQRGASLVALALAPTLGISAAQAQPDVNNGAKADNPINRPVGVQMTPAQRLRQRTQMQLQALGVVDTATQGKLLDYIDTENTARSTLLEKAQQLQQGLRGNALSDAQVAALLNDYQAAVEDDKARRAKAEDGLKKDYDLAKNPKVEAMLVLLGVYGDGPSLSNGSGMAALMMRNGGAGGRGGLQGNNNAPAIGPNGANPFGGGNANTNPFLGGNGNNANPFLGGGLLQRGRNNRVGGAAAIPATPQPAIAAPEAKQA
jgi:hypothetical protein